jgi:hypothetical protein
LEIVKTSIISGKTATARLRHRQGAKYIFLNKTKYYDIAAEFESDALIN